MAKHRGIGEGIGRDVAAGIADDVADYTKLPGSSMRYKNKRTGKTISRRQYENIRARTAGWRNWSEYQRAAKTDDWHKWRGNVARRQNISYQKASSLDSKFSRMFAKVKRAKEQDSSILYDPDGPLAELLVFVGLRKPDAEWQVGDTP